MKCKVCDKKMNVKDIHKDDIEQIIKDDICWLCRAKGTHVNLGKE